jgi:hypothetical protein
MKKLISALLLLALLLALCACGEGGKKIKVELPVGLRFGMTQEEVEAVLGKADRKTSTTLSYILDYSARPEGFDPKGSLSPGQAYLLTEYTDGKLSVVTFSFDMSKDMDGKLSPVLSQAESYYTQKLGEPMTKSPHSGSKNGLTLWTDGAFQLSIVTLSEGGYLPRKNVMLMFRYGDEK